MEKEHEELHEELRKAMKVPGEVGKAAKQVAEFLHTHFEGENKLALPVIGIVRELAEGKTSPDFPRALQIANMFKLEYEKMLQEHVEITKALDRLEKAAKKARKKSVVEFARKLRLHAKIEEDLTYPAVLMADRLLEKT